MPHKKDGTKITWKEFFILWKIGINNITPEQKIKSEMHGTMISLLGFMFCFFAVIWAREKIGLMAYGLILVFLGSIITTTLRYISLRQQSKIFDQLNKESEKEVIEC